MTHQVATGTATAIATTATLATRGEGLMSGHHQTRRRPRPARSEASLPQESQNAQWLPSPRDFTLATDSHQWHPKARLTGTAQELHGQCARPAQRCRPASRTSGLPRRASSPKTPKGVSAHLELNRGGQKERPRWSSYSVVCCRAAWGAPLGTSAISQACWPDKRPSHNNAFVATSPSTRRAVFVSRIAAPSDMPVWADNQSAVERDAPTPWAHARVRST